MSHALYVLFGRKLKGNDLVAVFSVRLDETGTDGLSPITVVAGAVATTNQWDKLEARWKAVLKRSGVDHFHAEEFNDRSLPYRDWSALKYKRFAAALDKTIVRNTTFRTSVGIDREVHKDIKTRMKGVRPFSAASDYSLCFQYLLHKTSEYLVKRDPHHQLAVMVEDGPWSKGANAVYQRVKSGSSKHAHRLVGFSSVPFGQRPSLEAADLICDLELPRLTAGRSRQRGDTLSVVLTKERLEKWFDGMMAEKARRRAYRARKPKDGA